MRIRMFIFLLFLAAIPGMTMAQSALVRSGEHADFTRLVAPLPRGATWEVTQTGRTVTLSIAGMDDPLDISDVFDLIPRDRVATVSASSGRLVIGLGCDCRVAPFVAQDRFVVLDIATAETRRPVPFVPLLEAEEAVIPTPIPAPRTAVARREAILPTITPRAREQEILALAPVDLPALARTPLKPREQETLNDLQQQLARELGTATTRGLLDLVPDASLATVDPESNAPAVPSPAPPNVILEEPSARPNNLRITSSMDFTGVPLDLPEVQSLSGYDCPANGLLDVKSWATDQPYDGQIGPAYRALYGEFDKLDPKAAKKLVKLYLHFGFGAEALQIIALDAPAILKSEWWLDDIARIMEFGTAPDRSALASLIDCQTDIALWAVLARETIEVAHTVDYRPALRALDRLPLHLRQFIAPALSERFLSYGDQEAASAAMRNLERGSKDLAPAGKLAQARIAIDAGDKETAETRLEDVIDDNAAQSPEALITLVETQLDAGQPITMETAALVEAYAKELRDTPLGPAMRRAQVLALARSGQFDIAFSKVAENESGGADITSSALRATLLRELTDAAGDVVLLEHFFAQDPAIIAALPERGKIDLATRLLDLGFAEAAGSVLADLPVQPRNEARQLMRARIAIALSQPQRAQAALIEMTGPEVDALRAEAKRMSGDFAGAAALFESADRPEDATRTAWLDETASASTLSDDSVFGPVLALSDADLAVPSQLDGMLGRSTEVLEESAAARATLGAFLQASEVLIDPAE